MFNDKFNSINQLTRNFIILLTFIAISSTIFFIVIVHPFTIGISYDWNVPLSLNTFIKTPLNSSWINNSQVMPGNAYFLQALYLLLLNYHANSIVITISFLILVFSFSAFFYYLLLKKFHHPTWLSLIIGLLYLFSSQLLLITHHGYTSYLVSFCFTPLLIYLFLYYLENPKFSGALAGAIVFNLAANQIQFYVINSIILIIFSFFYYRHWRIIIQIFLIYITVNVLFSASWLLVYLNDFKNFNNFSEFYSQNSYTGFQINSIMDLFYQPFIFWSVKDYLQTLHVQWLYFIWTFCQILIFSLPFVIYGFYRKKIAPALNKLFLIGFTLLAIGFLLAKGRAEPFSWTGDWFYKIPLSGMFRDLNHFHYLITFSVVWLFALAVYIFYDNLSKNKRNQRIFFIILTGFILVNSLPYLLNVYQSRLHRYEFTPGAYDSLVEKYDNDKGDFRVLWLPTGFYVKYNDGQPYYSGINPLINMITKENLADLGPEPGQPSLLAKVLEFGYCGQIQNCTERFFGLYNVRDIINLKRDFLSTAPSTDNKNLLRNGAFWTQQYYNSWSANLYKTAQTASSDYYDIFQLSNNQYLPHLYVPKELTWVSGKPKNILDGIVLTKEPRNAYLFNDVPPGNADKLVIPLEFSEDSGLGLSHNNYQIITTLDVPEDGDYELVYYQKNRAATSPAVLFTVKNLNLDTREIALEKVDGSEKILKQKNPFASGKVFLRQGAYNISMTNSVNAQNLVINSSFEIGAWPEPTYDCVSDISDYSIGTSDGHDHFLQFHNTQRGTCQTKVVGELQPHQKYLFAFDVQHVSGEKPAVCLKLDDEDYCHGAATITDTADWQHIEFAYEQGESERALIYFSVPGSKNSSVNNFDNFDLRQVGLPETLSFVKDRNPTAYQVSQVEYRKINNTKYRVILKSASGNVPLVFSENYDPRWKAYVKSETPGSPDSGDTSGDTVHNDNLPDNGLWETNKLKIITDHQKINGFSNIWHYPIPSGPKDVEIIIEYKPQKLFIVGQYTAMATLGIILLFFAVKSALYIFTLNKSKD